MTSSKTNKKSDTQALNPEPDAQEKDSVFDFLYHDVRRVASFLAQFDDFGHITQIRHSENAGKSRTTKAQAKVSANLPLVAGATGQVDKQVLEEVKESAERVYDPLWSNARAFLDYLEDRALLKDDLWNATIGQFVIVKGTLTVLDPEIVKGLYNNPTAKKAMIAAMEGGQAPASGENRAARRREGKTSSPKPTDEAEIAFAVIDLIPHSVQMQIFSETTQTWMLPQKEFLVSSASDIILKHGNIIQGTWFAVGVLDAFPDGSGMYNVNVDPDIANLIGGSLLGIVASHFGPLARGVVGRPPSSFGITPLLIFRDVADR